ncbi:DUF551 domain-containing protein [Klebsiella quasipneumoniae]|uniref:DUF551 domain-containing protein n=1 Tax=Klebsiella quasipneumoniae TaxID=1463165 RepID=UPI0023789326|nr:DUF551 domain-containing protein [Klebsiella quasipneumoniae]MDD9214897.1 DUF551 domain-containing protein [Klebsiella quasipneumoniae]
MTKLTITRERLEWLSQISCRDDIEDIGGDEIRELARMALTAMDSESGCLPLDYLQGHKDGLDWAAQLAESNHPQTGDWLYDDPIELAKAIRKGPDMPPVQPVADSEPDRNPVLAYADSYRDMAKQGVESVPIWSVITDIERNIAPLYRHAQPAPVVPGKWIPVSEQKPDDDDFVYIWPRPDFGVELHVGQYCECSPKGDGWYAQVYEQNYGIEWHPITVTHWMPLPAAPQEVSDA